MLVLLTFFVVHVAPEAIAANKSGGVLGPQEVGHNNVGGTMVVKSLGVWDGRGQKESESGGIDLVKVFLNQKIGGLVGDGRDD